MNANRYATMVVLIGLVMTGGCQGTSPTMTPPNASPEAQPTPAQPDRFPKGAGAIAIQLPAISSAGFVFGTNALSPNTRSLGGTIGKKSLHPIPLSATDAGCAEASGGVQCTVLIKIKAGAYAFKLFTYANSNGTGKPLAMTTGTVAVYVGKRTYASAVWTGLARTLTAVLSPSQLQQGRATPTTITPYAVDASGAIIPSSNVSGPTGAVQSVWVVGTGPYYFKQTNADGTSDELGLPIQYNYDGRLAGSEALTIGSTTGGARNGVVRWTIAPATSSAPGKVFVQGIGAYVGTFGVEYVFQYANSAANGPAFDVAEPNTLVAAQDDGTFWAYSQTALYHYSQVGTTLSYVPATFPGAAPDRAPQIAAAAVDRSGNVFVVDEIPQNPSSPQSGVRGPYSLAINEYAGGGYSSIPTRTIQLNASDYSAGGLGVDASGNVYYSVYNCYQCGYSPTLSIVELSATATSDAAPVKTISVGQTTPFEMSVDAAGDVFLGDCLGAPGCGVTEYTTGGSTNTIVSGDGHHSWVVDGAADAAGNCYVIYGYDASNEQDFGYSIVEYPAGSSQQIQLVSAANAGLSTGDLFGNPIVVAP